MTQHNQQAGNKTHEQKTGQADNKKQQQDPEANLRENELNEDGEQLNTTKRESHIGGEEKSAKQQSKNDQPTPTAHAKEPQAKGQQKH